MPSFTKTAGVVVVVVVAGLAALGSAMPAHPRLTRNQLQMHEFARRQNALATAAGLTDVDILQFALTLEKLEAAFYQQGFARFPEPDFLNLGLQQEQVDDLVNVGQTEQSHVTLLQSAIAQAGVQPVQECIYAFNFSSAAAMVATAGVLESVGVSAYLGAAKLISNPDILTTAASILTVEARHETFIRAARQAVAVPSAFDTPLSPRLVFTLAAPFIATCPAGSNLALTPFPSLSMQVAPGLGAAPPSPVPGGPQPNEDDDEEDIEGGGAGVKAGTTLQLQSAAAAQATHCGFINGGQTGGTAFAAFSQAGGCVVPQNLKGVVYVVLTNAGPLTGQVRDDIVVAGPMVMVVS